MSPTTRRLLSLPVLALALLVVSATPSGAATEPPVQIRRIELGAHPSVTVTVAVPRALDLADFRITENGAPARVLTVRPLATSGTAVDVVIAIDTSRSVRGKPLAAAVAAAKDFVGQLSPEIPVGIVTFSDQAREVLPISQDRDATVRTLDSLTDTQVGTALFDGAVEAVSLFSGKGQHNVVLFTDGADHGSSATLEDALVASRAAGATVFAIGLNGAETDFDSLTALATETGGTFSPAEATDLSGIYQSLAERLTHQYVVLYQSTASKGAQVTVGVMTPAGNDQASVLVPRGPAPAPAESEPGPPFLRGDWGLLVVLGLCFIAASLLLTMFFGAGARGRRDRLLARRMAASRSAPGVPVPPRPDQGLAAWIPEPFVEAAEAAADAVGFKAGLDQKLDRAGLSVRPGEVLAGSVLLGLFGLLFGLLAFRSLLFGVLLGAVGAAVPFLLVGRKLRTRMNLLHEQLSDVLMILASSMRAGHSFLQALDTVAKEIGDPAGPEFARVVAEIRLGRAFEEAMMSMAERVGSEEFKWAMLAINVQREVGGNLAEILDTLSETVRERAFVKRQVKVLSAEGRLSVKILIAMPFLLAAYLFWVNPDYMRLLWTTRPGIFLLAAGAILMAVGTFWARKVVKIDV